MGPAVNVLVVNVGGVTLDLSVVDSQGRRRASRLIDPWDGTDPAPIAEFAATQSGIDAVGHRVVHGGERDEPAEIDQAVLDDIARARALSPVHQDRALAGIAAARAALPGLAHVACFDTTFHRTLPDRAALYALPATWRHQDLRRRGFHGLSHSHVAGAAPTIAGREAGIRVVSCHLGSGASCCAIAGGRSLDTTMGATPLEGLVMARRSGSVDPGVLLWLLEEGGLTVADLRAGLTDHAGLAGLTGGSGDMRDVLACRAAGQPAAIMAFDLYIHRLRAAVAAMAAALGGIDVLAFTGGVGEHLPPVRSATTAGLGFLGIATVDEPAEPTSGDRDLTRPGAGAACVVVATGEDLAIAAATRQLGRPEPSQAG